MQNVYHFPMTPGGRCLAHHGIIAMERTKIRSTSEIWADLYPLTMTGEADAAKREALMAELEATGECIFEGRDWL